MRNAFWLLLAVLIPPLLPATFAVLTTDLIDGPGPDLLLLPMFYAYALIAVLAPGLPAALVARKLGVATWWAAVLCGLAIAAAFAPYRGQSVMPILVLIGLGGLTGLLFWIFARKVS